MSAPLTKCFIAEVRVTNNIWNVLEEHQSTTTLTPGDLTRNKDALIQMHPSFFLASSWL
jgi:hypothetical protein